MKDEIISYREMCDRENVQTLQRGMNFRLNPGYSVILMSQRRNAPYKDKIFNDGFTIEYEGHDIPNTSDIENPKKYDQPRVTKTGKFTQNGLFANSVEKYKKNNSKPELIKVYEKIFNGVWSERGFFKLIDYKFIPDEKGRKVFRFILEEVEEDSPKFFKGYHLKTRTRIIPSEIKKEVWKRDGGKCVICGATDELHFDHDLPFSKGGTSISFDNVRILCARHNLSKSNKIE
jgi:hypothetical protein